MQLSPSQTKSLFFGMLLLSMIGPGLVVAAEPAREDVKTKVEQKDDGGFYKHVDIERTDKAGTLRATDHETDVDVDGDGTITRTRSTEETTDPKGLLNKSTTKTTEKEILNPDGTRQIEREKTVNGKTVEDVEIKKP